MVEIDERELALLKNRAQSIELSSEAYIYFDEMFQIVDLNSAARKLLNIPNIQSLPLSILSYFSMDFIPSLLKKLASEMCFEDCISGTAIVLRSNPDEIECTYSAHRLQGHNNDDSVYLLKLNNRESKCLEDQNELEKLVTARTRQLERINADLNDFAYVVSHDLKAPLRAIYQLTSWIMDDYLHLFDEDGKEQMGMLCGRVEQMSTLIDGVLQYSRAGREENLEQVDLNTIVNELVTIFSTSAKISLIQENTLPTLYVNETHITQIFQNIMSNAEKFMDRPRGEVRVYSHEDETRSIITIRDNGPGIEERHHSEIFKIFNTLSHSSESSGVGLAIVKKLINQYGGSVTVESALGKGAAFHLSFEKNVVQQHKGEG